MKIFPKQYPEAMVRTLALVVLAVIFIGQPLGIVDTQLGHVPTGIVCLCVYMFLSLLCIPKVRSRLMAVPFFLRYLLFIFGPTWAKLYVLRVERKKPVEPTSLLKLIKRLLKFIKRIASWPFITMCPNCESAWTGGHPNPGDLTFCVVCSNPRTGKIRSWVWRGVWLHKFLVSRHNFKRIEREDLD